MTKRHAIVLFVLALLTSSGCESCNDRILPPPPPPDAAERLAHAICSTQAKCGCGLYDATTECERELTAKFEELLASGFSFDEDCFESYLQSEFLQGCPTLSADLFPGCTVVTGTAKKGEPCLPYSLVTMMPNQGCEAGLQCTVQGVCGVYSPKQVGDPCDPNFVLSCGSAGYCSSAGTCVPRRPEGEGCDEPPACELGLFCDGLLEGEGVCAPQLAVGESCEPDELYSCAGPSGCYRLTTQCDDTMPWVCLNLEVLVRVL